MQLHRGLALAAGVEVGARPQGELLARQRDVAPAEQRGQPLLRRAARATRRSRGRGSSRAASQSPSATCSPSAVADAHDERAGGVGVGEQRVRRRHAMGRARRG